MRTSGVVVELLGEAVGRVAIGCVLFLQHVAHLVVGVGPRIGVGGRMVVGAYTGIPKRQGRGRGAFPSGGGEQPFKRIVAELLQQVARPFRAVVRGGLVADADDVAAEIVLVGQVLLYTAGGCIVIAAPRELFAADAPS